MGRGALWDHLAQAQCRRHEFESYSQLVASAGLRTWEPEDILLWLAGVSDDLQTLIPSLTLTGGPQWETNWENVSKWIPAVLQYVCFL